MTSPVRYVFDERVQPYVQDLNFPDHAMIWRDAFDFVSAGNQARDVDEFWQMVREEYFIEGGGFRKDADAKVEW